MVTLTCETKGCGCVRTGKSKYCQPHREAARQAWLDRIQQGADERKEREAKWEDLHKRAHAAGMAAGEAVKPLAMVVTQHENMLDDNSPVTQAWYEPEGVCGFAWVTVRPGNHSFALWLKKNGHARSAYQGGVMVWVGEFNQSMQRKQAYAQAYAAVLHEAGIERAYAQSRMD